MDESLAKQELALIYDAYEKPRRSSISKERFIEGHILVIKKVKHGVWDESYAQRYIAEWEAVY